MKTNCENYNYCQKKADKWGCSECKRGRRSIYLARKYPKIEFLSTKIVPVLLFVLVFGIIIGIINYHNANPREQKLSPYQEMQMVIHKAKGHRCFRWGCIDTTIQDPYPPGDTEEE